MYVLESSKRKLDVYLINMSGADKRRETMLDKLSTLGLPVKRIDAVDGRKLAFPITDFCELSYKVMHGRRTSPCEIGCYLSHVECARSFLRGDAEFALILEDDVNFHDDFVQAIDDAICHAHDWDVLRLSTVNNGRKFPFKPISPTRSLAIAVTREKGAGAYIINRKAASWITTRLLPMRLAYDIAFDLEYLAGLKAAFIHPLCASQDAELQSQIQDDVHLYRLPRWRYLSVLPYRAYLETTRFICRAFRVALCKMKYRLASSAAQPRSTAYATSPDASVTEVTPASRPA